MRLLTSPYPILILILLLSFCSCHSSRQTRTDYADSSRIDLDATHVYRADNGFHTLLSATRAMELSGLEIVFYPPDTLHPGLPPAPMTITVGHAVTKDSATIDTGGHSTASVQDNVDLAASSGSAMQQDTRDTRGSPLSSLNTPLIYILLILVIAIAVPVGYSMRKTRSPPP
ncbi:hypothetical protein [uncultured Duncaniella sp.]|jgi:hypothetical protein|uniref:hypothetical protein n=1 Tax=uncultured Duncaniella sp. TaxID=2768039 RepID=UPI0025AF45F5|nr:hypothetical protein [uncultured Duncaniella sp.]